MIKMDVPSLNDKREYKKWLHIHFWSLQLVNYDSNWALDQDLPNAWDL